MTLDQFIDKLEADGGWETTGGCLANIRRKDTGCCPLEHVAGIEKGTFPIAKIRLGLTYGESDNIMVAADGVPSPLRARLLKACGLEEAPQ